MRSRPRLAQWTMGWDPNPGGRRDFGRMPPHHGRSMGGHPSGPVDRSRASVVREGKALGRVSDAYNTWSQDIATGLGISVARCGVTHSNLAS